MNGFVPTSTAAKCYPRPVADLHPLSISHTKKRRLLLQVSAEKQKYQLLKIKMHAVVTATKLFKNIKGAIAYQELHLVVMATKNVQSHCF